MARKEGNFLRGAAGPVIYRVVRGKQIVSIKPAPGTVKQSEGTKVSSQIFGMASSWGANIRRTFEINAEAKFDSTVSQRLTGALRRVLGRCRNSVTKHYEFQEDSFKDLLSFDFNINSKVKSLMPVIPAVSIEEGVMQVMVNELLIPAQFRFPSDSFKCQLAISRLLIRSREGLISGKVESQSLEVTRDMKHLDKHIFKFNVPDGCLCIASMSLRYSVAGKSGWKVLSGEKFNPSCICGALITPGTYQQDGCTHWTKMRR